MKIAVTGASGFIGSALVAALTRAGHSVAPMVRRPPRPGEIGWEPSQGRLAAVDLEGCDAVVHLAGETIFGRWTAAKKRRIRESRVAGTELLARTLAQLGRPPDVLVCSSAVGYYGDRGEEPLREESPPGSDFLAEVCRAWEAAAEPARAKGIRTVHLRTGVVLSPAGGALGMMLLPFKLGLGGRLGSGRQYMSWIARDDLVSIIQHVLATATLAGPVNAAAPEAVTNAEFTRTLGRVLKRPTVFPVPAFVLRLLLGEMAEALLLSSQRVEPARLVASGYSFQHPQLEGALRALLKK